MDKPKTKVLFRRFRRDGDIIAIMPEISSDDNPFHCQSYMHIGQHGSCDPYELIADATVPAKPFEYAKLLSELKGLGYDVVVIKRTNNSYLTKRRKQLQEKA